ncbi:response regulator receiver modulated diguanylate phosphodiesterase [Vibrio sinaloensis DSM 21326]|uniref:Response regulator receiver modulated diguanylate phosphodiesterase n=1 Tax=Vibrio sinaloensis DSM 21326 TaxID=945550 RepID=E8M4B4_PHOS4|nr:response regulator [Vibrio sinaloensis]EGA71152.1 response regulator receiver modulated diguanylate phosphodiesterase [Vibrio sinaloensis DSM 21326]
MSQFDPTLFTILVVEDHKFSRQALIGMLVRSGYENVLSAKDGQEAIDKCNRNHIDLIITDINMPKVNGLELIKSIRQASTQIANHTSILAVTTLSDTSTISACMTLEVDAFLVKPISVKCVQEKIQSAVCAPKTLFQQHLYEAVDTHISLSVPSEEKDSIEKIRQIQSEVHELTTLSDLRDGMTLVYDINANNGGCLLKAGTVLNEKLIKRLFELSSIIDFKTLHVRVDQKQLAV